MGKLVEETQWSIVRQRDAREAAGEDIHNRGKASISLGDRGMSNNEKTRKETGGERDEDAEVDVQSHEER